MGVWVCGDVRCRNTDTVLPVQGEGNASTWARTWHLAHGTCHMAHRIWHMAHSTRHMEMNTAVGVVMDMSVDMGVEVGVEVGVDLAWI